MTNTNNVYTGKDIREKYKKELKLFGLPTGTKLDEMFYEVDDNGNIRILNGIPSLSVMNLVGKPDTGKSVLAQQFAIMQIAEGRSVLFVTSENPARHTYNALIKKAKAMDVDTDKVDELLYIIDITTDWELREEINKLIETMKYAYNKAKEDNKPIRITVIDSITGLYEAKEFAARSIARRLYNLLKQYYQTSLVISQKRSSQESDSAEAAGGYAVSHIFDGTIVFDKKVISSKFDISLYGLELGEVLRLIRIDGCRLCGHETKTYVFEITEKGLIDIKEPLSDFVKKRRFKFE